MYSNCPICHSNSYEPVFTHIKWKIPCVQCNNCSHVFASEHIIEVEDNFKTNKARARYFLSCISSLTPASMMDIGTPEDFFYLSEAHTQFPSAKTYALDLYKKDHPDFVEMRKTFPDHLLDICTAFHVLEHVEEPHSFIQSIINGSKYFIIEVPNCDTIKTMRFSSNNPHTHFFNLNSFKELFSQSDRSITFMIRSGKDMPWKRSTVVAYCLPEGLQLKNSSQTPIDFFRTQLIFLSFGMRRAVREIRKLINK